VVIVLAMWAAIKLPAWFAPGTVVQMYGGFLGPMAACAALVAWWLLASRIGWRDRLLVLGGLGLACAAGVALCHPSVRFGLLVFGLPVLATAWVGWLLVTAFWPFAWSWPVRRAGLLIVFVLLAVACTTVRLKGLYGDFTPDYAWRWAETREEQLAATRQQQAPTSGDASRSEKLVLQPGDWPAFRGPNRDGQLSSVRIDTSWKQKPPRELWRRPVGPGWSSFAVIGNRLYTQEQVGNDELVTCYAADTGTQLWTHADHDVRHNDVQAGPGPRATPTFHEGKIFALGGTGQLNCLDAVSGQMIWSHNVQADAGARNPEWGFASSPLVAEGIVMVFAGGPGNKALLGYRADSGELAWSAGQGEYSYCSPQPATLDGVDQVLLATDHGLMGFDATSGRVLWDYARPIEKIARIIQPAVIGGTDVLVGAGFGQGTQRVRAQRTGDSWTVTEAWSTKAINPYFNDLVVHHDHLYGFDNSFLTCVSLADGTSRWRARGYRSGQVLLLPDQDLLLVLSETGDVALVEARPEKCTEIARFKALDAKTWNHPVIAHGKLFVRNSEEMACYAIGD
jgi:outer membrane protein assembly factor BamB